jgi:hypothetical protein
MMMMPPPRVGMVPALHSVAIPPAPGFRRRGQSSGTEHNGGDSRQGDFLHRDTSSIVFPRGETAEETDKSKLTLQYCP